MNERFKLAANVLLKRRLNNLVRIDHQTEIDRDFITCAEYQLFIHEMRQQRKHRQPDHWTAEKFSYGEAKKPVTGVRSSDAEEFCQWLTEIEMLSEFSYRLPTVKEIKEITVLSQDIGCWYKDNNSFKISGIATRQWRNWQQKLSEYFIFLDKSITMDFFLEQDIYRNINKNINFDGDLYFNFKFDEYFDFGKNFDRDFKLNVNRYLKLYRDLKLYQDLFSDFDLYRNRDLKLYRNLYISLNRDLNLYIYRDDNTKLNLNHELYTDLNLNLDLYNEITTDIDNNFLFLYFPLIVPTLFYHSLSTIYSEAALNGKIRRKLELSSRKLKFSRQECEQRCQEYAYRRKNVFLLYAYLVLMEQRQKGNMPAWEGIRIVRERKETN